MALPKSHLAWLRAQSKQHTAAIAELRRLRDTLAKEITAREAGKWQDPNPKPDGIPGMMAWLKYVDSQIAAHEQQAELVRDQRWTDALAELLDDPKRAQAAARDPRGYARKLGVNLPPDLAIDLRVIAGRPNLTVTGLDPVAPFEFNWTEDGFTSRAGAPGEEAPAQRQPRRSKTAATRKRPPPRRSS
jgi:hypothetical protein